MKLSVKYSIPAISLITLFVVIPAGMILFISLYKTNFITWEFIGLNNYRKLVSGAFPLAVENSLLYMAFIPIPGSLIALGIAISMADFEKGRMNRTLFLFMLPIFAAGIIISQSWRWVIRAFNINMSAQLTGVPMIALMTAVSCIGPQVLMFSMAIKNINPSEYEAAQLDGASQFIIKTKIILPQMWKPYFILLTFSLIGAMQIWEFIYMTAPFDTTASMMYRIINDGFMYGKYGLAASECIIMVLVILGITEIKKIVEKERVK